MGFSDRQRSAGGAGRIASLASGQVCGAGSGSAVAAEPQDYSLAMSWFARLNARDRVVVRYRSCVPRYSYRQIGERLNPRISRSRVKELFERVIDRVAVFANGTGRG